MAARYRIERARPRQRSGLRASHDALGLSGVRKGSEPTFGAPRMKPRSNASRIDIVDVPIHGKGPADFLIENASRVGFVGLAVAETQKEEMPARAERLAQGAFILDSLTVFERLKPPAVQDVVDIHSPKVRSQRVAYLKHGLETATGGLFLGSMDRERN